jgi:erythritol transport system ATP-binding protein
MNARPGPATDGAVVLAAVDVSKVFPGTVALDKASFDVRPGAVNVLVGENGAGKSTLMKILAGVEQPTSGQLLLDGRPVAFHSVRDAARCGIGIIYQELNLCPNLSVAENIFIGTPIVRYGVDVDGGRQIERARELMHRLEQTIDPRTLVGDLRIGQQQIVEIAKALAEDVRILIMDEPTSALSSVEVDILFRVMAELKAAGVAIVYISHRLDEIMRVGDYVTVMRDGRVQARAPIADVSIPWIVAEMVGPMAAPAVNVTHADAAPVLVAHDICLPSAKGGLAVDHVSLTVRAGEVVGIYGLMGAGRSELFECMMGLAPDATGSLTLAGKSLAGQSTAQRIRNGLALVPEDRQSAGLIQSLSVAHNVTLSSLWRFVRGFSLDAPRESRAVKQIIADLSIKVSSPDVEITALSGGNQQKVVIGKGLLTEPRAILLDEPGRGIDVGAKAEVFRTMRRLGEAGLAVVFATSDLHEVMAVADRIIVMASGRVTGDFARDAATEAQLVAASHPRTARSLADVS